MIVAMGPGETLQALSFARYAEAQGVEVVLGLLFEETLSFLSGKSNAPSPYTVYFVKSPRALAELNHRLNPDILFLFNSKIFRLDETFRTDGFSPRPFTVTVDSNWLFRTDSKAAFPALRWADLYAINLPADVFRMGLKEYGGHYEIPKEIFDRLKVVGMIPSFETISPDSRAIVRQRLGLSDSQFLIFHYSGKGVTSIPEPTRLLLEALKSLDAENLPYQIAAVMNPFEGAPSHWRFLPDLSVEEFYRTLAASDLVVQHQGMGSLAQSISAGVPVIAVVPDSIMALGEHHQAWELEPFRRMGACEMRSYGDDPQELGAGIIQGLRNPERWQPMKEAQKLLRGHGESSLFKLVRTLSGKSFGPLGASK